MTERAQSPSPYSAIVGLLIIVGIIIGGLVLLDRIETDNPTIAEVTPTPPAVSSSVSFVLDGLTQLNNAVYAVWAQTPEDAVYLGSLNVNSVGKLEGVGETTFTNNELETQNDLTSASRIFMTIEQEDVPLSPTGPEVVSADVAEGIGALVSPFADLGSIAGEYLLATPTDGANTNETSGVWFVHHNPDGSESVAMTLPVLPKGWEYSGVVEHQGTLLYTGSFTGALGSDSSSIYNGEIPGPAFPGEDFLSNKPIAAEFDFPPNLTDGTSEVSVRIATAQPYISQVAVNEYPIPALQYTVLRGMIVQGADINTNYPMTPVPLDLPAGIVVIR